MAVAKKIVIPAKHYVGMSHRADTLPLGFLTPWGEDAAAKKRMDTVDSWVNTGYSKKKKLAAITIDNNPMLGFKLTSGIRTGQYGAVDKWRVEDPRGFELEISSPNLAQLLSLGTVENGEFLDQCVWGRDGGNNILLSVESEDYKEAIEFTKINSMSTSWKDVKIGNEIILQNGLKGKYLGKMNTISVRHPYSAKDDPGNSITASSKPYYVIHTSTTTAIYSVGITTELHFISSPKLSQIVSTTEMTVAEAEIEANYWLHNNTCEIEKPGHDEAPIIVTSNTIKPFSWTLSLEPILDYDKTFSVNTFSQTTPNRYIGFIRLNSGELVLAHKTNYDGNKISMCYVLEDKIRNGIYVLETEKKYNQQYYRSYQPETYITYKTTEMSLLDFQSNAKKKYRLLIKLNTNAGNTFEVASNRYDI